MRKWRLSSDVIVLFWFSFYFNLGFTPLCLRITPGQGPTLVGISTPFTREAEEVKTPGEGPRKVYPLSKVGTQILKIGHVLRPSYI